MKALNWNGELVKVQGVRGKHVKDFGNGVSLRQTGKKSFQVIYGLQVTNGTYKECATELGNCLMHSIAHEVSA